jgi:hypothetical protein
LDSQLAELVLSRANADFGAIAEMVARLPVIARVNVRFTRASLALPATP